MWIPLWKICRIWYKRICVHNYMFFIGQSSKFRSICTLTGWVWWQFFIFQITLQFLKNIRCPSSTNVARHLGFCWVFWLAFRKLWDLHILFLSLFHQRVLNRALVPCLNTKTKLSINNQSFLNATLKFQYETIKFLELLQARDDVDSVNISIEEISASLIYLPTVFSSKEKMSWPTVGLPLNKGADTNHDSQKINVTILLFGSKSNPPLDGVVFLVPGIGDLSLPM